MVLERIYLICGTVSTLTAKQKESIPQPSEHRLSFIWIRQNMYALPADMKILWGHGKLSGHAIVVENRFTIRSFIKYSCGGMSVKGMLPFDEKREI